MNKYKKYTYITIILFSTFIGYWAIPSIVEKVTYTPRKFPLMYYSSILKELCIIDFRNDKDSFQDIKGNIYEREKYDSLLPLLNSRMLMMNGKLPDSIDGVKVDIRSIRSSSVAFKYRPIDMNTSQPSLGVLFESIPKRDKLVLPGDYFRLKDKIEFINSETNQIDETKSELFNKEMIKRGFSFPAKEYWGNPSTKKMYDEGYFCLDSKGELFHLKMVNSKPFVRNTEISKSINIRWFSMYESIDKRFYGFVFGDKGEMGIIESSEEGGLYRYKQLDILPLDIDKDQITILGNMLYWTVTKTNDKEFLSYGLDKNNLKQLSKYNKENIPTLWEKSIKWLFPFYITFTNPNTTYIKPYINIGGVQSIIIHIILAITSIIIYRKKKDKKNKIKAIYVLLLGIPAFISLLLFKD